MSKKDTDKPIEAPVDMKMVEDWQKEKGTEDWVFIAAQFCAEWPQNKMVSAAEYDAGIARVLEIKAQ